MKPLLPFLFFVTGALAGVLGHYANWIEANL